MELSERGRWATEQFELWITNDATVFPAAEMCTKNNGTLRDLVLTLVETAKPGQAAWHVGQALDDADWDRVDWVAVSVAILEMSDDSEGVAHA